MTEKELREIDRERQQARQQLLANLGTARHDLHPALLARRWRNLQLRRIAARAEDIGHKSEKFARKNAGWLSLIAVGALLFAGRKPILKWVRNRRSVKVPKSGGERQDIL